ncbi:MAG: hypothetical protein ACXWX2_09065, partial [Actinomycetota bacterium]
MSQRPLISSQLGAGPGNGGLWSAHRIQQQRHVPLPELAGAFGVADPNRRELFDDQRKIVDVEIGTEGAGSLRALDQSHVELLSPPAARGGEEPGPGHGEAHRRVEPDRGCPGHELDEGPRPERDADHPGETEGDAAEAHDDR